jgi:hypothetical protein
MNLNDLFQQQGLGVMATASKDGVVNTAVYQPFEKGLNFVPIMLA